MDIHHIKITYVIEDNKPDFTIPPIPYQLIPALIYNLRDMLQRLGMEASAPSFAEERARIHQRHLEYCKEHKLQPVQQFIDFPVPENFNSHV